MTWPSARHLYILNGREAVEVQDLMQWALWMEDADRRVARTTLLDGSEISTVFLGLRHGWGDRLELFETAFFLSLDTDPGVQFNGRVHRSSDVLKRYETWAEAEVGHMEIVEAMQVPQLTPTKDISK